MNYKEKYTKETGRKPYCYNAKGEIVQSASYGDGYVKWLEKQLSLCCVVVPKGTLPNPFINGLNKERIKTYAEISKEFNISTETVGNIFDRGISWYMSKI